MTLSFITKVEKEKEKNHTPLDTKKLSNVDREDKPHAVVIDKKNLTTSHIPFAFDKYILITIISVLFFLSGFGFWVYVNYFMS